MLSHTGAASTCYDCARISARESEGFGAVRAQFARDKAPISASSVGTSRGACERGNERAKKRCRSMAFPLSAAGALLAREVAFWGVGGLACTTMPRQQPPPSAVHCPLGRGVIRLPESLVALRDRELALWPRELVATGCRITSDSRAKFALPILIRPVVKKKFGGVRN